MPDDRTVQDTPGGEDSDSALVFPGSMPGRIDDRYECQSELGRGGMGRVFVAYDPRMDRKVAIKVLARTGPGPTDLRRFEQEARAAGALNHPNVLTVHDVGTHGLVPYIACELLEGATLREALAGGPFSKPMAADYAIQLARGLAAAHGKGIVHRDLKPENVFVTADGRIKILDFGVAKLLGNPPAGPLGTESGVVIGTLGYMSPEQVRGHPADERSDVFGFGAVLYEMLTGKRAFAASSAVETGFAILNQDPPQIAGLHPDLQRVVQRCLKKDPADRYPAAQALLADLERAAIAVAPRRHNRALTIAAVATTVVVALAAGMLLRRESRLREARETIPRIATLIERNELSAAFALGRQVEKTLPGDPLLAKLWPDMSRVASIETEPSGADVAVRDYDRQDRPWMKLGRSPLVSVRIPLPHLLWRITKEGFDPAEVAPSYTEGEPRPNSLTKAGNLFFALQKPGTVPAGMVRVTGGEVVTTVEGLHAPTAARIPDYFLDRYEVTNKDFKKFVDAGGYRSRAFWREPFAGAGRALSWEEAMAKFRDRSGTPGPASWTSAEFPDGEADLPVTGVSWYEAAAYAVFAGKSLPTIYHWDRAAGIWAAGWIVPASNFGSVRLVRAGSLGGTGPYGTKDMAGNAKEWCWNADGEKRYLLGGSFDEPGYMFGDADAQAAFDRSPRNGFRLAKYLDEDQIPKALFEPHTLVGWRAYTTEEPVPEATFRIYRGLYAYDRGDLRAAAESTDDSADAYRRERITVSGAYGNERLPIIVFTPKGAPPPYQTVLYFPSTGAVVQRSSQYLTDLRLINFLVRTGRAVVYPIYKSTYERGDDFTGRMQATAAVRDHVFQWVKEARRTIDYVESRRDLDAGKIAFVGLSWGAGMGPIVLAVEDRLKAGILVAGGLSRERQLPEVDPFHFAPHVRQPVLMINGRYDWMDPLELSQLPLFRLLGSPSGEKRHFVAEGGHGPAQEVLYKETQAWLDGHLGPVR